jgi:acid phosphatase type 7
MASVWLTGCQQSEFGHITATRRGDLSLERVTRVAFDEPQTRDCGPGGLTHAGSARLMRRPYLQKVQTTLATLVWTARAGQDMAVEVITVDGAPVLTAPASVDGSAPVPNGHQFTADLISLQPDTPYCYRLRDAADDLSAWTGFRTAPVAGSNASVRFVAVGDSGARSPDQDAVISAMKTIRFDLLLNNGDLAGNNGALWEYEETFFQPFAGILDRVASYVTIGNHEYRTAQGAPFRQVFALPENGGPEGLEHWYSFDWGDIHFVALNTNRISQVQASWLKADLTANKLDWTIVLTHDPAFSSGWHGGSAEVRAHFLPIFEAHAVALVISGHDHHYERSKPVNGVTYVVTGGGGRGTRSVSRSETTAFSERVAHFIYVELVNGKLRLHAIDGSGKEFDGVELMRSSSG